MVSAFDAAILGAVPDADTTYSNRVTDVEELLVAVATVTALPGVNIAVIGFVTKEGIAHLHPAPPKKYAAYLAQILLLAHELPTDYGREVSEVLGSYLLSLVPPNNGYGT